MIKIENLTVHGFEEAIRGMRNPMNSWDRSDSYYTHVEDVENPTVPIDHEFHVGEADKDLMMRLANGGPVHAKYRRMITVYMDITAPLYWWKEFDTYKVGTVRNSCSTMHKIHEKEFTLEDFSFEHLIPVTSEGDVDEDLITMSVKGSDANSSYAFMEQCVWYLNYWREKYLEAKTKPMKDNSKRAELMKKYWWQMIQLLPSSYNQRATVMLNYETLAGIYRWRKDHKLDEWREFCKICAEELPHSEIFTFDKVVNDIIDLPLTNVMTTDEIKKVLGVEQQKRELEKFRDYMDKQMFGDCPSEAKNDLISYVVNETRQEFLKSYDEYMKENGYES